jgi:Kef-type K+ transport system membrane component KefB
VLGAALAYWLRERGGMFAPAVGIGEAVLYLGAAMSITAFPMLARIVAERGIGGTHLGTLALAAGSIGDAAAWCVLAVVLGSFSDDWRIGLIAIGGGLCYTVVTLWAGRPLLRPLGTAVEREGRISSGVFALAIVLLMIAAFVTERIGVHAVFGAFILGTAMPRGKLAAELHRMIGPLTSNLLVPIFFVYSGLHTRIDLVNSGELWGIAIVVLAAAVVGKFGACWAAARLNGESPRDSLAIGALMNARGMMELIILNIGLQRGLITPELFTVMVIMAIVTTLMASPLFLLVYRGGARPA